MLLYLFSIACSPMDKPGAPFKPLAVVKKSISNTVPEESTPNALDSSQTDQEASTAEDSTENNSDEVGEEFRSRTEVIVSEETESSTEGSSIATNDKESTDSVGALEVPLVDANPNQELAIAPSTIAPSTIAPSTSSAIHTRAEPSNFGWPIRVVKTSMELVPPRAIIGLPDGSEIVVQSGHMLPEQNLVVMSIGERVVGFAKIHAHGDHARVEALELMSQN